MHFSLGKKYRPYHNEQDQVVVDLERGVVVDSRALNEDQFNRYFRTVSFASRPDMNERQASEYFKTLKMGERFLELQKKLYQYDNI